MRRGDLASGLIKDMNVEETIVLQAFAFSFKSFVTIPSSRNFLGFRFVRSIVSGTVRSMKFSVFRILILLQAAQACAFASNSVVNMSHYDLMKVDFERMRKEGVVGVIHEATYPRFVRDAYYGQRQNAAARAGLLWGAYHFGDATDPVRQAEHFLNTVEANLQGPNVRPEGVLLVLDFEKNGHYPGGTMRADQAVTFVEYIRQRTGHYPGLYCSEYRSKTGPV